VKSQRIGSAIGPDHTICLPPVEILLWDALTADPKSGVRFSRDIIMGDHIIGICSRQLKTAVELDLPPVSRQSPNDLARMEVLRARGYKVINVPSRDVYLDAKSVCASIVKSAKEHSNGTLDKTLVAR
jgi:very-short-patch-repair endonuclease